MVQHINTYKVIRRLDRAEWYCDSWRENGQIYDTYPEALSVKTFVEDATNDQVFIKGIPVVVEF